MDGEGIDGVLTPTIGICWEGHVTDGALATAYTRAYNRWLAGSLVPETHAPIPVGAHRSWIPKARSRRRSARARTAASNITSRRTWLRAAGSTTTIRSSRASGRRRSSKLRLSASTSSSGSGRWFDSGSGDPSDGFGVESSSPSTSWQRHPDAERGHVRALSAPAVRRAQGTLNWIAAWLDRLDHEYRLLAFTQTPIRIAPSEYFRRQCMISADPDVVTADDRAPGSRLLRLGVRLSAHRRIISVRCTS